MTSDEADGEVGYDQQTKQVYVKWNNEHHQRFYFSAKAGLEEAIGSLGGNMGLTPKFSGQLDSDAVTRHPLGGCSMGETGAYGVVNHMGSVFIGMYFVILLALIQDGTFSRHSNSDIKCDINCHKGLTQQKN